MSFRFKWSDFTQFGVNGRPTSEWCAEEANRLLDEYVKTLPSVFCLPADEYTDTDHWIERVNPVGDFTHRARLWGVKEIKPCEHVAEVHYGKNAEFIGYPGVCHKCGVKLKPTGWVAE